MPASDWEAFVRATPWLSHSWTKAVIRELDPVPVSSPRLRESFPHLAALLDLSRHTHVSTQEGEQFTLHSWTLTDATRTHWLCLPPGQSSRVCEPHGVLLEHFGGITERGDEPEETWLANHNDALTLKLAGHDVAATHAPLFDDIPPGLINPDEWYPIAEEANSDLTLCHRLTSEVLLLSHDDCRSDTVPCYDDDIRPLLFRIPAAPDLVSWVETVARQWLHACRP